MIDFIDMESEANKKKVLTELRNHLRKRPFALEGVRR